MRRACRRSSAFSSNLLSLRMRLSRRRTPNTTRCLRRFRRAVPSSRSPLRVDARRVRAVGASSRQCDLAIRFGFSPSDRKIRNWALRRRWRSSLDWQERLPHEDLDSRILSLVLLVGPSGSGKSSFGAEAFLPTEVISSDFCRGLVSDDENDQSATGDAFDILHAILPQASGAWKADGCRRNQRAARSTQVPDRAGTGISRLRRARLSSIFRRSYARNATLRGRIVSLARMWLEISASNCGAGCAAWSVRAFGYVFKLSSPEEVDAATIERQPLWNNRKQSTAHSTLSEMYMAASTNCWIC